MNGALLIDCDSKIPNLALMHISAWRKSEGLETGWNVQDPSEVWASIVFEKNKHMADGLKFLYPNAMIDIGGGIRLSQASAGGSGSHDARLLHLPR